jgi:anti-sigma regulatory factor (Ser/Thr protein kinase)|tara:strand:+ start:191 stop:328 length:138 start_codon:yes stop_codon:yes gene_type:complete
MTADGRVVVPDKNDRFLIRSKDEGFSEFDLWRKRRERPVETAPHC